MNDNRARELREKRLFKRLECQLLGECVNVDNKNIGIRCKDISSTGAGFIGQDYFPVDADLNVNLVTNKASSLPLKGRVRWTQRVNDDWRTGVAFYERLNIPLESVI